MGFFQDNEPDLLTISGMVLHVIGAKHEFVPMPAVEGNEHNEFFLTRIRETAASAVHSFSDNSTTKALVEEMARGDKTFVEGAQELARRFSIIHTAANTDGAFFVVQLAIPGGNSTFYCLIKYDYRAAVEMTNLDGKTKLRQIVQAFVRDRRAMQKFCLVRVTDGAAGAEVCAVDRMGKTPDLTDYFESYLDVARSRDDEELSGRLSEALREVAVECKKMVPGLNIGETVKAAKAILSGRETVDEDAVVEAMKVAVGRIDDEHVNAEIDRKVARALRTKHLTGVSFLPNQHFFKTLPQRKVKTEEGVTIDYPGELENNMVRRTRTPGGGWQITILTSKDLAKDETVPSKVSRAAG